MPDLPNIASYPALVKTKKPEEKPINVDKPGTFPAAQNKGVRVRVMKMTKRVRMKKRDPRKRIFY